MGKLLKAFNFLLARLGEPSTYASIAAVLAAVGVHMDQGLVHDFLVSGSVISGIIGVFVRESSVSQPSA